MYAFTPDFFISARTAARVAAGSSEMSDAFVMFSSGVASSDRVGSAAIARTGATQSFYSNNFYGLGTVVEFFWRAGRACPARGSRRSSHSIPYITYSTSQQREKGSKKS